MSEPWIRVYAADMRADPAITELNDSERYALIQAWDLAKNGPGDPAELRAQDGSYMGAKMLLTLCRIDGRRCRNLFSKWARFGLCAVEDDGLVRFPNLPRRQGIDRTNALRQKRYRQRHSNAPRNGESNGPSNGPVTGENQSTEDVLSTDALGLSIVGGSQNVVDRVATTTVWEAYAEHHPQAKLTPARRQLIQRRLRDHEPDMLVAAIHGNHRDPHCNGENPSGKQYHGLELILRGADHIERYAAIGEPNGRSHIDITEAVKAAREAGFLA